MVIFRIQNEFGGDLLHIALRPGKVALAFSTSALARARSASEGNLVSPDTQVDYQPLQQLLAHQKWREANKKTGQLEPFL